MCRVTLSINGFLNEQYVGVYWIKPEVQETKTRVYLNSI